MMVYLMLFRSIPAFLLYLLLSEEERKKVDVDLQNGGYTLAVGITLRALQEGKLLSHPVFCTDS